MLGAWLKLNNSPSVLVIRTLNGLHFLNCFFFEKNKKHKYVEKHFFLLTQGVNSWWLSRYRPQSGSGITAWGRRISSWSRGIGF